MTIDEARQLAANLLAAADRAEAAGRADLAEADLDVFAAAAESGLAALDAAIERVR